MPALVFHAGTMNSGKSTTMLQMHQVRAAAGQHGLLYTRCDRRGAGLVTSRMGCSAPAVEVSESTDLYEDVLGRLRDGDHVDYVFCDETQFYSPVQVEQAADVVDRLHVDVHLFGILTDFRGVLFPASARAVELADTVQRSAVQMPCWCGEAGTHHARLVAGKMVTHGPRVVVGDVACTEPSGSGSEGTLPEVTYEVLCRKHHRMAAPDPSKKATVRAGVPRRP